MARRTIDDNKVRTIWEGIGVEGGRYTIEVTPDWFEENGTPVDFDGNDMVYLRTEIEE